MLFCSYDRVTVEQMVPRQKVCGRLFVAEIAQLHKDIEILNQSYQKELETVRNEAKLKIDYLRAENEKKDRIIDRLLDK